MAEVEAKIAAHDAAMPAAAVDPLALGLLASNLKTVWFAPTTDARLKKRIVRTIIHEVVADIDDAAAEIVLVVHWVGGVHSEMRLPKRRRGQRNSTSADVITAVRQLVLIANDDLIAGILNRNGLKTGNGHRWTRERVTSMRSNYRIPVFKPAEDGIEPWLNLSNAAKLLRIAPKTLRLAAEAGEIEAIHPLPDGPWIFARAALATSAARSIAERARQNPRYPRDRIPTNKASSLQPHSQMGVVMRDCKVEVAADRSAGLADAVVGAQIHLLVFDAAPQPLDEHVVPPGALAVHADRDAVAGEHAGEGRTGELRTLVGVEDVRLAVTSQSLLSVSTQNAASMVIDSRHASTRLNQSSTTAR